MSYVIDFMGLQIEGVLFQPSSIYYLPMGHWIVQCCIDFYQIIGNRWFAENLNNYFHLINVLVKTSDKASVRSLYHRAVIEQHTATPPAELFSDKILNAVFEGQAVLLASRPAIGRGTMAQCKNLKRGEFYTARELIGTYHAVIFYNRRMPIHLQEAINER